MDRPESRGSDESVAGVRTDTPGGDREGAVALRFVPAIAALAVSDHLRVKPAREPNPRVLVLAARAERREPGKLTTCTRELDGQKSPSPSFASRS